VLPTYPWHGKAALSSIISVLLVYRNVVEENDPLSSSTFSTGPDHIHAEDATQLSQSSLDCISSSHHAGEDCIPKSKELSTSKKKISAKKDKHIADDKSSPDDRHSTDDEKYSTEKDQPSSEAEKNKGKEGQDSAEDDTMSEELEAAESSGTTSSPTSGTTSCRSSGTTSLGPERGGTSRESECSSADLISPSIEVISPR